MRFLLIALVLSTGCGKAVENAKRIDPKARCVNRAGNMAYCLIHGKPYICDNGECLPVPQCTSASAALPVLESGNGTKYDH